MHIILDRECERPIMIEQMPRKLQNVLDENIVIK